MNICALNKNLVLGIFAFVFSCTSLVRGEVEPSTSASISVTPDATVQGDTEVLYNFGADIAIPLSSTWYFTPGYSLGINTVNGLVEYFSTLLASLTYDTGSAWSIKPAFFETLSHSSGYHSEKMKNSFIYSVPDPSTLAFYFGPSFFQDSDQNKKLGAFTGLSGDFTEKIFWYLDAEVSSKINSGQQNSMDQSGTVGAGYNITDSFSFSFDVTVFRGPSGVAIHQQNEQVSITAKPSKTISKNNRKTSSIEITFTAGVDYNF